MTTTKEFAALVRKLALRADPARAPGWEATLGLSIAGLPWLSLSASQHGIAVEDWGGDRSSVKTEIEMSEAGLRSWLMGGVDYTHLLKRGEIELRSGNQFDLLLLSKSFGLRPERRQEVAR